MMKSILVALDGSPAATAALQVGVRWAETLGAELRGIFVEDESRFVYYPAGISAEGAVPVATPLPDADLAEENRKVREEGEAIRKAFQAAVQGKSLTHDMTQERGDVNEILIRHARAVDLVVMGRRGAHDPSGSTEAGPTTETLIHNALRPVLVVPAGVEETAGPFVFAYDGSKGAHRVVTPATELACAVKAKAAVITVGDDARVEEAHRTLLERYWKPYGLSASFHAAKRHGKTAAQIVAFARENNAGMVAMGAFGHHPLHELFFGSTTLDALSDAPCPVLLMA